MSLTGRTLAHYRIAEEISRGGMGVVYRATDTRLDRDVALKVLPAELVADAARRQRFVQEARAASALEHPNIAVIHDIGEIDGISYIAMELVRGDKLSVVLGKGALSPGRTLEIAAEIAEGLARAHSQGIVHRDLKPANVMLTEDGHAKVIDFGLAKLIAPLGGETSANTFAGQANTDPNVVMGTVSYMSPEQARGGTIDHRSDIFSFGVMLYEMLAGKPPFQASSSVETLHAILHSTAAPLAALQQTVGYDVSADIQRILDKCLSKDPDARYQGMKDLVVDLRAARRRMETGGAPPTSVPASAPSSARKTVWPAAAAVVLLAGIAAAVLLWRSTGDRNAVAEEAGTKPSVAVLYFENNTGNPQMDWLRSGLADMLVTDLSQSPDVDVLSTDRMVQILGSMQRLDDRVVSFDTVQEIARRAGVKTVLVGSYVKAGDAIRINLKVQDAMTGRIISSERVDAQGESNLFPTMDELTRRIKARFTPAGAAARSGLLPRPGMPVEAPDMVLDRDLKDVTTASIEAFRYYAEGIDLLYRARYAQAIPLMEKATAVDPSFALAIAKLGILHGNLGHSNERDRYTKQAFEHSERLTPRERLYIEGAYYSNARETIPKAIEAYSRNLELYPTHTASRNNLALIYLGLERYADAIKHFEVLQSQGFEFAGMTQTYAAALFATGHPEQAFEVIRTFINRQPASEFGYTVLGNTLLSQGKLDEAAAALEKADSLNPGMLGPTRSRAMVSILREDWEAAARETEKLLKSTEVQQRLFGHSLQAAIAMYQGRGRQALASLANAAEVQPGSNESANVRTTTANLLLDIGRPADALAEATRAVADARGRGADIEARRMMGVAQGALGRAADAATTASGLAAIASQTPSDRDKRRLHLLNGLLALNARDSARALEELRSAEALLPVGPLFGTGFLNPARQPAVPIWFAMGRAHLLAGRDADAAVYLRKIADGAFMRLFSPVDYVRSLYLLAEIAERQGDLVKAREYYARFLRYWKDGDMDRDRVQAAMKKLAQL